ncbi:MAG: hypothetical protein OCD01_10715 [Fibrobacterales bacterium]
MKCYTAVIAIAGLLITVLISMGTGMKSDVDFRQESSAALCMDGIDTDLDGRVDCDDSDCIVLSVCQEEMPFRKGDQESRITKAVTLGYHILTGDDTPRFY